MIIFGVHYSGVDLLLSCLTLGNWPSDWLFSFHWIPVGIYLRFFFSSGRTVGAFKIDLDRRLAAIFCQGFDDCSSIESCAKVRVGGDPALTESSSQQHRDAENDGRDGLIVQPHSQVKS